MKFQSILTVFCPKTYKFVHKSLQFCIEYMATSLTLRPKLADLLSTKVLGDKLSDSFIKIATNLIKNSQKLNLHRHGIDLKQIATLTPKT